MAFDPCAALPCATVKVDAKAVKALRDQTGAGMMDCKKALVEAEGDAEVAVEALRAKGLAAVDKKAGRSASEGIIETYIHTGAKLGVMVAMFLASASAALAIVALSFTVSSGVRAYVGAESQGLLDRLFDGRLAPLVMHFSQSDKLSDEDIAELRALVDRIGK